MADDNSQTTEPKQEEAPKEEPKDDPKLAELESKLAAKEEELQNTNAYVTKLQQEQSPAKGERDLQELVNQGIALTPEQQKEYVKKMAGTDETEKQIETLKSQLRQNQWKSDLKELKSEYSPKDGYPTVDEQALSKFMEQNLIGNPKIAYEAMNKGEIYSVSEKKSEAKSKPVVSDSGDNPADAKANDEEYQKALSEAKKSGASIDDLVVLRQKFGRQILK